MRLLIPLLLYVPLMAQHATLDGAKVAYSAAGKGETVLVLIHGWTCDRTLWDAQIQGLKDRYRVLAVDLPGHGASETAPDYSMKRFARAAEAVMRKENVRRAVLVGHSMGGAVMLEFARLFPEKVAAIVAVDAMMPDSVAAQGLIPFAARFEGPQAREVREKMVAGMFTEATTPEMRAKISKVMLGTSPETAAGAMKGIADQSVWRDDVIDVPLLEILAGSNRNITEEALKKRFPRAKVVRVPGAGHFLQIEKPEEVNRIIVEWLKELGL